ncbi:MAG: hypothetical protein H0W62_07160 [Chitinophagales bacterium]|nr:hypothetical protein [Chitinophagales bacterium]
MDEAGAKGCGLVVFGEGLLPGYPFWVELTDGARFNSEIQKEIYAHHVQEAVQIHAGDFKPICETALRNKIAIYLGCIERAADRGNYSLYCGMVYIDQSGTIGSVHQKLVPAEFYSRHIASLQVCALCFGNSADFKLTEKFWSKYLQSKN